MGNIEWIKSGYEAFGKGDFPAVLELFADDVVWTAATGLPFGGEFRGKDAVLGFFQSLPKYWDEINVLPEQFVDAGDLVFVRGTHTGSIGGQRVSATWCMVWKLENGKIVSMTEYTNSAAIQRVLDTTGVTA